MICYLLLVFIGWMNIYASIHSANPSSIFDWSVRSGKQFIWMLTSFGLAALILFVFNPRFWEAISIPSYIFVGFLLILVIFVSNDVKGSHSWFELGPVKFQPAEISKITTSLLLAATMSKPNFKLTNARDFITVALIIGIPMLTIVAESETGSALVYLGFMFALYREGLSGWLLVIAGMCVLLFILTLTASPYTSIVVLMTLVTLFYSLEVKNGKKWIVYFGLPLLLLALLPKLWGALCESLIPGSAILGTADASVTGAIVGDNKWAFLLKFKPMNLLMVISVCALPVAVLKAYRDKRTYLWVALGAFLLGIILTFSTEFIFDNVLQDHQRGRIEVLLGMKEDPSGLGYNVNQSKIAIGSGGLIGKGFLHGTQTTYGFVPEQSTDFIFCTVGEEWGFVGCAIVILLYSFLIMRIISDAEKSREAFTRIYGYCVASCIFMHLFINVGMAIGLMPVIGIPLPMLSYGGSSLWAFTIMIFIFIALDRDEKKYF
ncbi:MAG: rod shape-determining protein RodA [Bacteroidia bacterium]|nr:rod shape-determining protein RodA [Bacteroidia bacterium]